MAVESTLTSSIIQCDLFTVQRKEPESNALLSDAENCAVRQFLLISIQEKEDVSNDVVGTHIPETEDYDPV